MPSFEHLKAPVLRLARTLQHWTARKVLRRRSDEPDSRLLRRVLGALLEFKNSFSGVVENLLHLYGLARAFQGLVESFDNFNLVAIHGVLAPVHSRLIFVPLDENHALAYILQLGLSAVPYSLFFAETGRVRFVAQGGRLRPRTLLLRFCFVRLVDHGLEGGLEHFFGLQLCLPLDFFPLPLLFQPLRCLE